jgi:hypothetical protein
MAPDSFSSKVQPFTVVPSVISAEGFCRIPYSTRLTGEFFVVHPKIRMKATNWSDRFRFMINMILV